MRVCIGHSLLGLEADMPIRKGFMTTEEIAGCGENRKVYGVIQSASAFLVSEQVLSWPESRPE